MYDKYPIHGSLEFKYGKSERNRFPNPERRLPPLGDSIQCSFIVKYRQGLVYLAFRVNNPIRNRILRIQHYYRLVNQFNDEQSKKYWGTTDMTGVINPIDFGESVSFCNEKFTNDFIKNNCLIIEYGIHLEWTHMGDRIWRFNFWNGIFDYKNSKNMIIWALRNQQHLYSHKLLVSHHSPLFYTVPVGWNVTFENYSSDSIHLERCLQILHGVRLNYEAAELEEILKIAENLKMYNVSHYCQYQLMAMENYENLKFSFSLKLRHLLQFQLLRLKMKTSKNNFKKLIMDLDIQQMTGESMKLCTRFILDHF
ncbi:hypothetical protein B9Z55_021674 [Caenorhabditis nigoni]|uniref:BTB domain-containing protein n=1 Tax=Caenorhabditis nigoni TaxID=1611254 RepID=A0A2G5TT30_9PELO|nr:hypothetical protein B9Z55_021674 [Caenorhabditis nigoni]